MGFNLTEEESEKLRAILNEATELEDKEALTVFVNFYKMFLSSITPERLLPISSEPMSSRNAHRVVVTMHMITTAHIMRGVKEAIIIQGVISTLLYDAPSNITKLIDVAIDQSLQLEMKNQKV